MAPEFSGEVAAACDILLAAQRADWGPIQHAGDLHDRATYRYFWQLVQRARVSGQSSPRAAEDRVLHRHQGNLRGLKRSMTAGIKAGMNQLAFLGAVNGFLAVGAGAFAAHGLKARLDADMLAVFETGARYHLIHALALFIAAWLASREAPLATLAGWLFAAGILLFSGSLYALALPPACAASAP